MPELRVDAAEVRLPPIPGRPGVAYFKLGTVHGPTRLTRLSSPKAGRVEMHETIQQGGVTRMVPLAYADLDDNGVTFEPGGKHAMLHEIAPDVRPGTTIALTFHYDAQPVGGARTVPRTLVVNAPVHGAAGSAHAGH